MSAQQPTAAAAVEPSTVLWPPDLVEAFWDACCCVMDLKTSKILEQTLRKGTGTENFTDLNSCHCSDDKGCASEGDHGDHGHSHSNDGADHAARNTAKRLSLAPYCFNKATDDVLGARLQEAVTKKFFIQDHLKDVVEMASQKYESTVRKAQPRTLKEKAGVQALCIHHAIKQKLVQTVHAESNRSERMDVKDGGKLAFPQSYKIMFPKSPYIKLNNVASDAMIDLMSDKHYCVLENFLGTMDSGYEAEKLWVSKNKASQDRNPGGGILVHPAEAFLDDLEWIEMHSLFENQTPFSPDPHRTDSTFWVNAGQIPPELSGLAALSYKLTSLPFELNEKTQAKLTISNHILLSVYQSGNYFKKHIDNLGGPKDNGRTFTCLYNCIEKTPVVLEGKKVLLGPNSLLIMKTRKVNYEIPASKSKRYFAFYWCRGDSNF